MTTFIIKGNAKYLFEVSEIKVVIFSIRLHEYAEFSLWNTRGSVGPQMKKRSAEVQNYPSQLGGGEKDQVSELFTSYEHLGLMFADCCSWKAQAEVSHFILTLVL